MDVALPVVASGTCATRRSEVERRSVARVGAAATQK